MKTSNANSRRPEWPHLGEKPFEVIVGAMIACVFEDHSLTNQPMWAMNLAKKGQNA